MERQFQFSLRRLLAAVTAICLVTWLVSRVMHGNLDEPSTEIAALIIVVIAFGVPITVSAFVLHYIVRLTGRPTLGAAIATVVLVAGILAGIVFLIAMVAIRLR
jgi:hypothetical protein